MLTFLRCFLGPRLYRIYKYENREGIEYAGNALEHYSDAIVKTARFSISLLWSLGLYTSPLVASFMYRRGYFTPDGIVALFRLSSTVGILLFLAAFIRGIGRMMSSEYMNFILALDSYRQSNSQHLKLQMARYDFDFREWPVDFRWNESVLDCNKSRLYLEKGVRGGVVDNFKSIPCNVLSLFAIHTFGRMMIYPGSVGLLNVVFAPMLMKGRAKLIEEYKAERFKLFTREGNEIDSVFIDRRNRNVNSAGNVLVICCEGNSGFYEFGVTGTPIDAGYSVLGWNHPGFGGSTGMPFPDQETNAIDVVMHFAVSKLHFKIENIIIYAWSIGGFTATWAAMNFPNIKGLILDATFDDLVALAIPRMPSSWKSLVIRTVRDHMNLNVAEQLNKYNGPVLLVRRTKDEMIATNPSRSIQTNRGNDLLIKLLQSRYPKIVNNDTVWALKDWVSGNKAHQSILWSQQEVDEDLCEATLTSYIERNGNGLPLQLGDDLPSDLKTQLILYLADKHMIDYDSTHCVPLPAQMFQLPWELPLSFTNAQNPSKKSHM